MAQLVGAVTATARRWHVDTLPSARFLQVEDEIVEVTARYIADSIISVRRGIEGSTAVSHDAGTELESPAFGGGSVEAPLVLEADGVSDPFHVVNHDGGSNDGAFLFEITPDGGLLVAPEYPSADAVVIRPLVVLDSGRNVLTVRASSGLQRVNVGAQGHLKFKAPGPPDDAELFASECAFWFDDTNGAAKIKFKGKTANGTVVNGEVALT